jgi:hypothetical protein
VEGGGDGDVVEVVDMVEVVSADEKSDTAVEMIV